MVSSVFVGEPPRPRLAVAMAFVSPRTHFPTSGVARRETSGKPLVRKPRELDCRHLEPRPVGGRLVRSNPFRTLDRLIRREHLRDRTRRVRGQLVLPQPNSFGLRGVKGAQRVHTFSLIHSCSCGSHFNRPKARMRFTREQHTP